MPRDKTPTTSNAPKRATRKAAAAATATRRRKPVITRAVNLEQRTALIAEAAFFRAEKRGFAPGHETEDWLAAEAEVDAKLMSREFEPH